MLRSRETRRSSAFTNPAALFLPPRQLYGIVHDGGGRNAIEMEQLEDADAQDADDFAIERADRPSGKGGDDMVERRLPAQRPRRDFSGKGTIALVFVRLPRAMERRRNVRTPGVHV